MPFTSVTWILLGSHTLTRECQPYSWLDILLRCNSNSDWKQRTCPQIYSCQWQIIWLLLHNKSCRWCSSWKTSGRRSMMNSKPLILWLFLHLNCLWVGYFPMPLATNQYFWDTESPKYETHEGQFLLYPNKWKNWASLKHKTNVGKINLR